MYKNLKRLSSAEFYAEEISLLTKKANKFAFTYTQNLLFIPFSNPI